MEESVSPKFNAGQYFYHRHEYTLNSGRSIFLTYIKQYQTYASQLEGIPWGRDGMGRAEWFRQQAEKEFDCPTLIVDQREFPMPIPEAELENFRWPLGKSHPRAKEYELVSLGPITCEALFESKELVRDGKMENSEYSGCSSILGMVWFQLDYAMPIDPVVLAKIKALDWEQHAINVAP